MACNLTTGFALDCIDSIGGVKTVYIGDSINWGDITVVDGAVTAGGTTATGTLYKFDCPKDTATYTGTLNVAPAAGTLFYAQELTLTFHKMDAVKRNQLLLLAQNRDLKVIFTDNNDDNWIMGYTRGANVTAGTNVTGTAPGDMNGYTLTLTANEPESEIEVADLAYLVDAGIDISLVQA